MNYNKHILKPIAGDGAKGAFTFSKVMAYFLHILSEVDLRLIENAKIYSRSRYRYIPWYPAHKGGGAITLGSRKKASITFTENFFSGDKVLYKSKAYKSNLHAWIRLSSHEVTHLEHARRYKYFLLYLLVFLYQYIRYGHDRAPLEIEANYGMNRFDALLSFSRYEEGVDLLKVIFNSDLDQAEQIDILNKYWNKFLKHEDLKKLS